MKSTFGQMLAQFSSRSLYVRLMLYAVLIITGTTTIRVLFVSTVLDRDAHQTAADNQFAAASYIAKDIDHRLRLRLDFLRLAADRFPGGTRDQLRNWLDGNLSYRLLFPSGLALYDPHGALIAETSVPDGQPDSVAGRDWLAAALASQDPIIASLRRAGADSQASMTMAAAVRDASGRAVALLAGRTALLQEDFLRPVYEQKIGEAGSVLVVDPRANLLVVSSLGPKVLAPAAPPGVNPLHDKGRAGFRGVGETVNADGQHVLSAMVSIPAAGWFLVVQQPTEQAYRPVWRLKKNFLLIACLTLVVAALVVHVILSHLLGPLIEAARRLHAMARGEAPVDFLPSLREDEIGLIVTGFNSVLGKLREKEALVSHMAHHDALTGLPNLQLFRDRLTQGLLHAQRHDGRLALLYLDLDGFKPVNDGHGHAAGDAVLKEVALRLSGLLRKSDTVARLGGDEFGVILTDPGDSAERVAEKCRQAIGLPLQFEGREIAVGVSIGLALFPADGATEEELLKKADAAMYRAKRAGREVTAEACKSEGPPL